MLVGSDVLWSCNYNWIGPVIKEVLLLEIKLLLTKL